MRITILTGPFLPTPPGPTGAVELVWHGLAKEFVKNGHTVTFLCKHADGQVAEEEIDGVCFKRRTNFSGTRSLTLNVALDLLYASRMAFAAPRADIIVANDLSFPLLARWLRPDAGLVSMHVARVPKGHYRIYRGMHRVVGVSSMIRDEILKRSPSLTGRVRFIPNPVDTSNFNPTRPDIAETPRQIVFTGRIHPEKGLEILIRAVRQLRREMDGVTLRIIGPWEVKFGGGGPEYLASLKQLAADDGITFCEPIYDRAELAAAIRGGRVYCYPTIASKGEAFPLAPLEAMACARVPVVSALEQFRDYIHDGVNGVVFNHRASDPATALAAAITPLLSDTETVRRMAAAATDTAQRHSFQHIAQMYLADFEEMLSNRG